MATHSPLFLETLVLHDWIILLVTGSKGFWETQSVNWRNLLEALKHKMSCSCLKGIEVL